MSALALFALQATRPFGERIATFLRCPLQPHEEREFEDGEHKARPLVDVRHRDVYVVQSLYGDGNQTVNDKLCRLLFFLGTLKDAGAARVTAVIPYLAYARKDRRTKPHDPVTSRYIAQLLEAVGVDHVLSMDVHNIAAFENAFRCRTSHLEAAALFRDHFMQTLSGEDVTVVSPDPGGMKRALNFQEMLEAALGRPVEKAFMEKRRSAGVVSGEVLSGVVANRVAIIVDDLISTGGTMARTADACRKLGARRVHVAATHGLFVGQAPQVFTQAPIDDIVITDTVPPFRLDGSEALNRLRVVEAAPLFGQAVHALHTGDSVIC